MTNYTLDNQCENIQTCISIEKKHLLKMSCDGELKCCGTIKNENTFHQKEYKQRTMNSNIVKHLLNSHRKCVSRRKMSSIFCQILLVLQLILCSFVLKTIEEVNAQEEYNRLSISDSSSIDIGAINGQSKHYSSDYRHVTHEELLSIGDGFDNFTDPGVTHFSEILFDFDHYQVRL